MTDEKKPEVISLIETCRKTALGYLVSLALWFTVVIPVLGITPRAGRKTCEGY